MQIQNGLKQPAIELMLLNEMAPGHSTISKAKMKAQMCANNSKAEWIPTGKNGRESMLAESMLAFISKSLGMIVCRSTCKVISIHSSSS